MGFFAPLNPPLPPWPQARVWVIGASYGIGAALAGLAAFGLPLLDGDAREGREPPTAARWSAYGFPVVVLAVLVFTVFAVAAFLTELVLVLFFVEVLVVKFVLEIVVEVLLEVVVEIVVEVVVVESVVRTVPEGRRGLAGSFRRSSVTILVAEPGGGGRGGITAGAGGGGWSGPSCTESRTFPNAPPQPSTAIW